MNIDIRERLAKMPERYRNCCWAAIIAAMAFIHCFRIGSLPCGINVDEMGMGYDAWCLANYGTDRYMNSFPVYLINFSGGQSALYAYLCAPFVYLFGISAWVLRMPAVIFSFITLFFSVRIADYIWTDKNINLLTGFLYTIFPVFLMLSRIGLDCNLMLGMSAMFLYFVLRAVNTGKTRDFFIAGIAGGMLLYSYILSHIGMPVFVLCLAAYLIYIGKMDLRKAAAMGAPLFAFALPLILFHIVNIFGLDEFKLGIFTIPKLYRYRSDDLSLGILVKNLGYFFQTTLLYDEVPFNSIPRYGNMYFFTIPFIAIGIIHGFYECARACKNRVMKAYAIITMWALSMYIMGIGLADGGPTVYRVNSVFLPYLFFAADGIIMFGRVIATHVAAQKAIRIFYGIVLAAYTAFFASFIAYYFSDYIQNTQKVNLFNFPFGDALDFIESELPKGISDRNTYIGDCDQAYIYYLGSTLTPPDEYNELIDDKPYTLWQWARSYKNYRFYFPEEIDPLGNYIMPDSCSEWISLCGQYGFKRENIGRNCLYWNDMLSETESKADALIDWGHGIKDGEIFFDDGENTFLSGWALNASYGTVWGDIVAIADGKYYYAAEKMDRKDVADILQNDALIRCGFRVTIPNERLKNSESIKIMFIDYTHRECYIETYSNK